MRVSNSSNATNLCIDISVSIEICLIGPWNITRLHNLHLRPSYGNTRYTCKRVSFKQFVDCCNFLRKNYDIFRIISYYCNCATIERVLFVLCIPKYLRLDHAIEISRITRAHNYFIPHSFKTKILFSQYEFFFCTHRHLCGYTFILVLLILLKRNMFCMVVNSKDLFQFMHVKNTHQVLASVPMFKMYTESSKRLKFIFLFQNE